MKLLNQIKWLTACQRRKRNSESLNVVCSFFRLQSAIHTLTQQIKQMVENLFVVQLSHKSTSPPLNKIEIKQEYGDVPCSHIPRSDWPQWKKMVWTYRDTLYRTAPTCFSFGREHTHAAPQDHVGHRGWRVLVQNLVHRRHLQ